jgi:hypothetical protein
MEFVLSLKTLWARRIYVAVGLVLAAALSSLLIVHGHRARVWVANSVVLVDSQPSAIGDIYAGLGALDPRASMYGNLMTSTAIVNRIGVAAGIPGDEIAVTGPILTTGGRSQHGAAVLLGGRAAYTLQIDTDQAQPTIRITARAPTSAAALALATGAGTGLASYVTSVENSEQVSPNHRIEVRGLGQPTEGSSQSGLKPVYAVVIFIALSIMWCMLVLFVSRFRQTWRLAAGLTDGMLPRTVNGSTPANGSAPRPATTDLDLELADPWAEPSESGHRADTVTARAEARAEPERSMLRTRSY